MISERIKNLRDKKGITQAQLARKLGISRAGVNSWEMGLSVPSTQYIVALAEFFQVSADYLLGIKASSTISTDGLTEDDISVVYTLINHLRSKK